MKLSSSPKKAQQGFTLIELVVVIVILGILAVTAAPKFIDLQDDARTATLQAVKASMQSASTLVHSKSLIAGKELASTATVTVNNNLLDLVYGYPKAQDGNTNDYMVDLLDLDPDAFGTTAITNTTIVYSKAVHSSAPTAITATCIAYYVQASGSGTPLVITQPTFEVVDCI